MSRHAITPSDYAQIDRAAERRCARDWFLLGHPEYTAAPSAADRSTALEQVARDAHESDNRGGTL